MNYLADMVDEAEAGPRPASPLEPAAWLALALLSGAWAWWAAKEGAYFGVVLLPGLIVLCAGAALLVRFAPWRAQLRLSPPVIVALVRARRARLLDAALGALDAGARHGDRRRRSGSWSTRSRSPSASACATCSARG